jgi:Zn-finger domain-containing protein
MNDDIKVLDKFLEHIEIFEIEGKLYNLENEVNLCTMGNKAACARVRKIIASLRIDLKELKELSTKMTKRRF